MCIKREQNHALCFRKNLRFVFFNMAMCLSKCFFLSKGNVIQRVNYGEFWRQFYNSIHHVCTLAKGFKAKNTEDNIAIVLIIF